MKFSFFLPTDDDWKSTFPGGFVKAIITNEPDKKHIAISLQGTGKYSLSIVSGEKEPIFSSIDMFEALVLADSLPRPISIEYLKKKDFEESL